MTGLGKMPKNDPKMAKFGFSANNFGTEGPRDLKFGLLASPGVGLPRTRIKKNRVPVFFHPTVCHMLLIGGFVPETFYQRMQVPQEEKWTY